MSFGSLLKLPLQLEGDVGPSTVVFITESALHTADRVVHHLLIEILPGSRYE